MRSLDGHDSRGNPAGQRPGFLYADSDMAEAVRETVHRDYDDDLENAGGATAGASRQGIFHGGKSTASTAEAGTSMTAHAQYRSNIENRWRR